MLEARVHSWAPIIFMGNVAVKYVLSFASDAILTDFRSIFVQTWFVEL